MTRRGSLVRRIVIPLSLLILGFAVIAAATGSITLRREIKESMDTTLREAAQTLLRAGVARVDAWALARAPR